MKRNSNSIKYLLISLTIFMSVMACQVHGQTIGIFQDYAILNINGGGNSYYYLDASDGVNPSFQTNLGAFSESQSLVFVGGQNQTYKCNGGNVTGGAINYTVWAQSSSPGSFTSLSMGFVSNNSGGCGGNQTWQTTSGTSNVISGLTPGAYYLEVYSDATSNTNSTFYDNNNNNYYNYRATFTVVPSISTVASNNSSNNTGYTGSVLTITGTGFTGASSVTIGGMNAASYTINSNTSITATVGQNATGTTVAVTNNSQTGTASFSYLGYITGSSGGEWNTGSTWLGSQAPATNANVTIAQPVTVSTGGNPTNGNTGNITIAAGGSLTIAGTNTVTLGTGAAFTNNSSTASVGAGRVTFSNGGSIAGSQATTFDTLTLTIGTLTIPSTHIPTVNGNMTLNGGTLSAGIYYGSNSNLIYNTGGTYGRNVEWSANSTSVGTVGAPNNVIIGNGTTLNYPNTTNFTTGASYGAISIAGSLTVANGSAFYMDYGQISSNTCGALTIPGGVTGSGNASISLGKNAGGDLVIGGNLSMGSGTFNNNGRLVTFSGASGTQQTISGTFNTSSGTNNNFAYVTINNANGVKLSSPAYIANQLAFTTATDGNLILNGNNLTLSSGSVLSNASATSGYIVTDNSGGTLTINGISTSQTSFPIGTSTSYTPLLLTGTSSSYNYTCGVSSTLPGTPPSTCSNYVNLAWSVLSSTSVTGAKITYQWNTANQQSGFTPTGACDLGVYTGTATGYNAGTTIGTPSGNNPYTITATVATAIPASGTNTFVIGNKYAFAAAPTVTTTAVSSISNSGVSTGGTSSGTNATAEGVVWGTSASPTVPSASSTSNGTTIGTYTSSPTLSAQTYYYLRAYATNCAGTNYGSTVNFFTLSNPPTVQASGLSATGVSGTEIDLSWTGATFPSTGMGGGASANGYILLRALSPAVPSFTASNGQAPAGTGTIYTLSGSATTFANTGIGTAGTYNYLLIPYTWDGTDAATYNYLTTSAQTASGYTLTPIINVSNTSLNFSNVIGTGTSGELTFTVGGLNLSTNISITAPAGIELSWTSGSYTGGTGNTLTSAAPNGAGTVATATVYASFVASSSSGTGLIAQGSGTFSNPISLTSGTASNSVTCTGDAEATAPTSSPTVSFTNVGSTTMTVNWSGGNGTNALVVVKAASSVDFVPTATTNYTSLINTAFGSTGYGVGSGSNDYIVYGGTSSTGTVNVTGLSPATTYYVAVYPYNGSLSTQADNFYATPGTAYTTTLATAPTGQSAGVTLSNVAVNSLTVSWSAPASGGSPAGYIVLQNSANTTPSTPPAGGTSYTAGGFLGNATILYVGTALTANATSLKDNTQYTYTVYTYNGSGVTSNYDVSSPPSAGTTTLSVSAPVATAATSVNASGFTANWGAVTGAVNGYQLDVSTSSSFSSFVSGYNSASVSTTSQVVTGLSSGTYYYRVRAVGYNSTSTSSSPVITVTITNPSTANYQSIASGNYSDYTKWQYDVTGAGNYIAATQAPGSGNNATIVSGNTITLTGNLSLNSGVTLTVNGTLNSGTGPYNISGAGNVTVGSGGTLVCTDPNGINGTGTTGIIQVTGTRTFSSAGNYTYSLSANGNSGNFFATTTPTANTVNNLTVDPGSGHTFTYNGPGTSFTVGNLYLNSGSFVLGSANTLNIASTGTMTGNGGTLATTGTGGSDGGTISFNAAGAITMNASYAFTFYNLSVNTVSTAVTIPTASGTIPTVSNIMSINSGHLSSPLIYGTSSTLYYNDAAGYTRYVEWSGGSGGTVGTTPGYPNNVTVNTGLVYLSNSANATVPACAGILQINSGATVSMNGMASGYNLSAGSLQINSGGTMDMSNSSSTINISGAMVNNGTLDLSSTYAADMFVGGNWTRGLSSAFNPNGRAVYFNGSATQTIASYNSGTETFDYLGINNSAANVVLSSSPATSITVDASSSNVLQLLNTGSLDLNGQTMNLTGNGGNIFVSGGARSIISSSTTSNGKINVAGYKTVTSTSSGTLNIGSNKGAPMTVDSNVIIIMNGYGLDYGSSLTTIYGSMQIASGSYVDNNHPPSYQQYSTLIYNIPGSTYTASNEWYENNYTLAAPGVPYNVSLINGTTLNFTNEGYPHQMWGNLTINSGSTVTLNSTTYSGSNQGDFYIKGNWYNYGTFNCSGRQVQFNGSNAQTLTGATTFDYFELINSAGLTLNNNMTVNSQLLFNSGIITTGSNYVIISGNGSGTLSGYSSSAGYIIGNLQRAVTGSTSYDFPLGGTISGTNNYELATINLSSESGMSYIQGSFTTGLPATGPSPSTCSINGTAITGMLNGGFWTLTPDAGSATYDITLHESGYTSSVPGASYLGVIKRHNSSSNWLGTTTAGSNGYHSNANSSIVNGVATVKRTGVTSFSDYGIGSSSTFSLPVKLIYFAAEKNGTSALLTWATASETDNAYFDIERSVDGVNFEKIGQVQGHDNSTETIDYSYTDPDISSYHADVLYYRLDQIDVDGNEHYSNIAAVTVTGSENTFHIISTYPNPFSDHFSVSFYTPADQNVKVSIYNVSGALVSEESLNTESGMNVYNIPNASGLASGFYMINISAGQQNYSAKMLKAE